MGLNWKGVKPLTRCYNGFQHLTGRYPSSTSPAFSASSGVPQGSHTGPLLFHIVIKNIKKAINVPLLERPGAPSGDLSPQRLPDFTACSQFSIERRFLMLTTFSRKSSHVVYIDGIPVTSALP